MPEFFGKFIFELEAFSYIRMGLSLAKQLMSPLDWNNIQKRGEQTVMQNYLHGEDKGVREETICLIFRWNIVLHDSFQADEIVKEIEEWKQKVIKCVEDISCILKKLYYMSLKFDYS